MHIVKSGDISTTVSDVDLIPLLMGIRGTTSGLGLPDGIVITPMFDRTGETYLVSLAHRPYDASRSGDHELPASWVIPWTRGVGISRGVSPDDVVVDDRISSRQQRMQVLMLAHQREWLDYHGLRMREK